VDGGGAECVELALSGACIKEMDAYLGILWRNGGIEGGYYVWVSWARLYIFAAIQDQWSCSGLSDSCFESCKDNR